MDDAATTTTVVWVAPARAAADRSALEEWALARGVHLTSPAAGAAPALLVDRTIAEKIEAELDRARDAIAAQETDGAERALARAEALLHAHPELPQAAWLMAEVERQWSTRYSRLDPRDKARADAAWQRAAALDGGRVAGVGESGAPPPPPVHASLALDGAGATAQALLDGLPVAPGEIGRPAGEHQLAIVDRGVVRYAAWIGLGEGTTVRVAVPAAPACSSSDLAAAILDSDAIRAPGVRCSSWVAAMPGAAPGALRVAHCSGDTCGPLVEWRIGGAAVPAHEPETPGPAKGGWPGWVMASIFGGGVVASMAIALAATGAFDKTQGTEPRFVNGGVKTSARR